MNGLESRYAAILEESKSRGLIADWWFEVITLKLAPDTRYTPDFMVLHNDGTLEFREVKGFMEDDAWVKLKVAADKFPIFRFTLIRQKLKRDGGGWDVKMLNEGSGT